MNTVRRVSYVFLCIVPFLSFVVVGVRAFRVPGVYQAVGVAYFAAIAIATWTLSAGAIRADVQSQAIARPGRDTPCSTICARCASLGRPGRALAGNRGGEPDAVSGPHCYGYRHSGWIRGAQRGTQRSRRTLLCDPRLRGDHAQWPAVSHLEYLRVRSILREGTCWRGACGDRLARRHVRCSTFCCGLSDLSRDCSICDFSRTSPMAAAQSTL